MNSRPSPTPEPLAATHIKIVQDKRYDILDGLPTYGPMYVPIAPDEVPFYSEGYVIRFYKSDGTSWVANFKTGWTNFSGVYDYPRLHRTIVFAFGQCYIMKDDDPKPLKAFGFGFTNAFQTDDDILIAVDQTDFTVIEIDSDTIWRSERSSWDGFKDLNFSGDYVTGLAYEPTSDEDGWRPFSFNYRTKQIIGGTYHLPESNKTWWKFW